MVYDKSEGSSGSAAKKKKKKYHKVTPLYSILGQPPKANLNVGKISGDPFKSIKGAIAFGMPGNSTPSPPQKKKKYKKARQTTIKARPASYSSGGGSSSGGWKK